MASKKQKKARQYKRKKGRSRSRSAWYL